MKVLKYSCLNCGTCCSEVPGSMEYPTYKRIPLYPDEADRLIEIAKQRGVPFYIIEDLVFPDDQNKKILVVTWRIKLDNQKKQCPFHDENGCQVHDIKPIACRAYPLAIKQEDAFKSKISIDPLCNWVVENYDVLSNIDFKQLKEIFPIEFSHAQNHLKRNKKIMLKLKQLENEQKIKIFRKISSEKFDKYLKEWDREEIRV
jgi:Fe-S-cluster containining protein